MKIDTIDKISTKGDFVYLMWSEKTDAGKNVYTLDCKQRAIPEFYAKLNQLADHVVQILELPDSWTEGLEPRGVSFTHTETEKGVTMGCVITSVKRLKSGRTAVINTPFLPERPFGNNDADKTVCLSATCTEVLLELQTQAKRYIGGERLQLALFPPTPGKRVATQTRTPKGLTDGTLPTN